MADNYEVFVGNIGVVYRGSDAREANRHFEEYAEQSRIGYGGAAYEDVTVFRNGGLEAEHHIDRDVSDEE
jgi:ribosomal protein L10